MIRLRGSSQDDADRTSRNRPTQADSNYTAGSGQTAVAAAARLGYGALLLGGVSLAVFFGMSALPGDAATQATGSTAPDQVDQLRAAYGLNAPLWDRYLSWWSSVFDGSFGTSLPTGQPVSDILRTPLQDSLVLAALAAAIILIIGVTLGIVAGVRPGQAIDRIVSMSGLVAISSPEFVLATLAIVVFADGLGWFPSTSLPPAGAEVWDTPQILALPALCLGLYGAGALSRMVRASTRVAYATPHVDAARMAGLPPMLIVRKHVLPSAWGSIATAIAQFIPYTLGGAVVIERVFGYPGIGSLLVDRIGARDTETVVTIVMILSAIAVAGYLIADACVAYFNRGAAKAAR